MDVSTTAVVTFKSAGLVSTLVFKNVANVVDLGLQISVAREKKDAMLAVEATDGHPVLIDASDIISIQVVNFNIPVD